MDKSPQHPVKIPKKSKIAFVCSGGGTKAGAFHLGVALALQERGFKFIGGEKPESQEDTAQQSGKQPLTTAAEPVAALNRDISIYVGSSAGSIIATYLASGFTLEEIFDSFMGKNRGKSARGRELKRLTYSMMFSLREDIGLMDTLKILSEGPNFSTLGRLVHRIAKNSYNNLFKLSWMRWSGLFSTAGVEKHLREDVLQSNNFHRLKPDLFVVATQLNHSRKVVFGKYQYSPADKKTVIYKDDTLISEACAGSIALPLVYAPFPIKNKEGQTVYYFDGEVRDTLSTHVAFDAGADLIISSYTHQPYHFTREIGSLHQYGMPAIAIQALYLLIENKIQNAILRNDHHRELIDEISKFFKENNLSDDLRLKCLDMIEHKLGFRRNVDYIYIHPKPTDHDMFFGDHFNLSKKKMSEIVRLGFRTATQQLRQYEFS